MLHIRAKKLPAGSSADHTPQLVKHLQLPGAASTTHLMLLQLLAGSSRFDTTGDLGSYSPLHLAGDWRIATKRLRCCQLLHLQDALSQQLQR